MSDSEDPVDISDDGDLFGDDDDNAEQTSDHPGRADARSDPDLESSRDEEEPPYGGYDDDEAEPEQVRSKVIAGVQMFRHRTPKSKDGTLQSLRVPDFLKWHPEEYNPETFQPSAFDVVNMKQENPKSVARWRKNPATGKLESNTNIYRWSDGSVTVQVGEDHYEMQTKALAPGAGKPYLEIQDGHYYAAAAHLSSNAMLVVGHITEQYTVRPNDVFQDEALVRLQTQMAAAAGSSNATDGDMIIVTNEDPELQKKQAELAEKERLRAQRRRENAAARLDGASRYNRGALSVGDLEGGRRAPGSGRKRGMPGAKQQKRRRPEYDSDDDLPQGAHRQEEYDMEDDFIAPSDEEISEAAEDDDDEELLDDDDDDEEDEAPRPKRQKAADAGVKDANTEANLDDEDGPAAGAEQSARHRRRNVIQEDDEEE